MIEPKKTGEKFVMAGIEFDVLEPQILVPSSHLILLTEAAEKWARNKLTSFPNGDVSDKFCNECHRESIGTPRFASVVHTNDCKAARILGLEREGA